MQHFCKKNVKKLQKRFFTYLCRMEKLRHGSLFSGIGGFDLAAEWMGWENVFHCEWNEFGQKVLKHYWPNAESFDDITKTNFTKYANQIDILTGGFPCQPYSMAGKRKGKEDERHLWPEMLRAIREIKPKYIVGENVFGLLNWNGGLVFDEVHSDLEFEGYEVQAVVIPAAAVNAPHGRDRVWFVATNTNGNGLNQCNGNNEINTSQGGEYALNDIEQNALYTNGTMRTGEHIGQKRQGKFDRPNCGNGINNFENFPTQSPICGGDDGIPTQLDGITFSKWRNESIKAYGNAIVPQVAYEIFKALEKSLYL
jgi:DNA (cytosine-5)-methyltransferase 1